MSSTKTKLELTWIGTGHWPKLEPRILMGDPDRSHHAKFRVKEPHASATKITENTKSFLSEFFFCIFVILVFFVVKGGEA